VKRKDGNDIIRKIQLSSPGPRIFAKSNTDNFEKAAAETLSELKRKLRKRKEILQGHKKMI
jgi:putative sigma-54 modulation protein